MTRCQTEGLVHLTPDPGFAELDWGLSWSLRHRSSTLLETDLSGHGGWSGCQWWMYPARDTCFVFLTNGLTPLRTDVDLDNLHNAVTAGLR
jgi:CubicO group peptidase (beta-lactamase class C family)